MPRIYKKKGSSSAAAAKKTVLRKREEYSSEKAMEHMLARVIPHADDSSRVAVESRGNTPTGSTESATPIDRPWQPRGARASATTALPSFPSSPSGFYSNETVQQDTHLLSKWDRDRGSEVIGASATSTPFVSHTYQVSEDVLGDDFYIARSSFQGQEVECDTPQQGFTVLRTTTRLYQVHQMPSASHFHAGAQNGYEKAPQETTEQMRGQQQSSEHDGKEGFDLEATPIHGDRLFDHQQRYQSQVEEVNDQVDECDENSTNGEKEPPLKFLDFPRRPGHTHDMGSLSWIQERMLDVQNRPRHYPYNPDQYRCSKRQRR